MKKYISEAISAGLIVLVGAGAVALVQDINSLTIAFAFFVSIMLLANSVGPISGGHGNPSISLGHYFSGKLSGRDTIGYIVGQFIGATLAGFTLFAALGFDGSNGLGTNALQNNTTWISGGIFEFVITFLFVTIILNVTSHESTQKVAPFIIALSLGFLVYIALPVTGGSLNAARSFGVAVFAQGQALTDLWLFFVFPTLGGIVAGVLNKYMSK